MMIFVSHRGFCQGIPENSMFGFQKSIDLQMNFIELDVQLSKDHRLVVFHDTSLSRIFNIDRLVGEMTLDELKKLSSDASPHKIMLLSEVMQFLQDHSHRTIKLMIDLKGVNSARVTCDIIKSYGFQNRCMFSGRCVTELAVAHQILPEVPLCLNITKCKEFTLEDLHRTSDPTAFPLPFSMFSLKSDFIQDASFINKCHTLGAKALAWNFKDKDYPLQLQIALYGMGLDGILFDDPLNIPKIRKNLSIHAH